MTKKQFKNNLYIVKWIDSCNSPNFWEPISKMKDPKSMVCASVGWIVKETSENIIIVPHISDINNKNSEGDSCGGMTIPKVAILERIKLK